MINSNKKREIIDLSKDDDDINSSNTDLYNNDINYRKKWIYSKTFI